MTYEDTTMSLLDYCIISEALVPRVTPFGTYPECTDGKVDMITGNITTWFLDRDDIFLVQIDNKGVFGFARHIPGHDYKFTSDNYVMDQSLPMTNSLRIFNKVFFLILLLADKVRLKTMEFSGAHPRLGIVYHNMLSNPRIIDTITKSGWSVSFVPLEKKKESHPQFYNFVLNRT